MRNIQLVLLLWLLASASGARAAAHGLFPGLSDLIGSSQAIVVAVIESTPQSPRTHSSSSSAKQKVTVLYSLKGDFHPGDQIDVALDSEILFPARTYLSVDDYLLHERYVLFISPESSSAGYGIVNAQGGAFWIPRDADLLALESGDPSGNIKQLLGAVLRFSRKQDEMLKERIRITLSEEQNQ